MSNDRVYYSHDAEIHAVREITRLVVFSLMIGLGIGAVLAILFAPMSGKKVRKELNRTVEQGLKVGRDAIEPMVKQVEKEFGEVKKNVEEHLK